MSSICADKDSSHLLQMGTVFTFDTSKFSD